MSSKPVVPAPESLLKKRKEEKKQINAILCSKKLTQKELRAKKHIIFQRAQSYAAQYRAEEKKLIDLRREARNNGDFFREPEARLAFVVRIRGINGVGPRARKILRLLRLRQINNGVFVRLNKATATMLRMVEPYITYGFPNLKTVKSLIYKRGFAKFAGKRIPIANNIVIERALGKSCGIICAEDLIHEIYTVGPNFKKVNRFLWPFKLNCPRGGLIKKGNHFVEGGDAGNREEKINNLVRRML